MAVSVPEVLPAKHAIRIHRGLWHLLFRHAGKGIDGHRIFGLEHSRRNVRDGDSVQPIPGDVRTLVISARSAASRCGFRSTFSYTVATNLSFSAILVLIHDTRNS